MNFLFSKSNNQSKEKFNILHETPLNSPNKTSSKIITDSLPKDVLNTNPVTPPSPPLFTDITNSVTPPTPLPDNILNKIAKEGNFDDSCSENSYNSSNEDNKLNDILDKVADDIFSQLNTEIYIISQDDIPVYYCDNHEKAHQIMWKLATEEKSKIILDNPDYNFYLCTQDFNDEVEIIGTFKNWFLNYENIFTKFNCHKVEKYEEE